MGRSVAEFSVALKSREEFLERARAFAAAHRADFADLDDEFLVTKGHRWWYGRRVLQVTFELREDRIDVRVEAWVETLAMGDWNADPTGFLMPIRRFLAWELASAFVRHFEADPDEVFRHD